MFFFEICDSNFLAIFFLCLIFFLEFSLFFHFFPTRFANLKILKVKNMLVVCVCAGRRRGGGGEGGSNYLNQKINQINLFSLSKRKKM
jgi:hypothetical protein